MLSPFCKQKPEYEKSKGIEYLTKISHTLSYFILCSRESLQYVLFSRSLCSISLVPISMDF